MKKKYHHSILEPKSEGVRQSVLAVNTKTWNVPKRTSSHQGVIPSPSHHFFWGQISAVRIFLHWGNKTLCPKNYLLIGKIIIKKRSRRSFWLFADGQVLKSQPVLKQNLVFWPFLWPPVLLHPWKIHQSLSFAVIEITRFSHLSVVSSWSEKVK